MPLPPPPTGATQAAPAPAVAAPVAAVKTEVKTEKVKAAGFSAARGDNVIPVPVVGGVNSREVIDAIHDLIVSKGIDLAKAVEAYKATPKSAYPGHKEGRAAYNLGGVLSNVQKLHDSLHKVRAVGDKKIRVKQSDYFKAAMKKLQALIPGGAEALRAVLGDDAAKFLAE